MNWIIVFIEAIAFAGLFTAVVFSSSRGDRKYSAASIHNYPPDIQEEYFKAHPRIEVGYRSKKVVLTKACGVLLFSAILLGCALLAGAGSFWQRGG